MSPKKVLGIEEFPLRGKKKDAIQGIKGLWNLKKSEKDRKKMRYSPEPSISLLEVLREVA